MSLNRVPGYILCFHERVEVRASLILFTRLSGITALGARDRTEALGQHSANGAPAAVLIADRAATAEPVLNSVPSIFVPLVSLQRWLESETEPMPAELVAIRALLEARCRRLAS